MTKETMIWQTISMIIAGIVTSKRIPETKEAFEIMVVDSALGILDYPREDIEYVFHNYDNTQFTRIIAKIFTVNE